MQRWEEYFSLGKIEIIQRHYAMKFIQKKLKHSRQYVSLQTLYNIYCIWLQSQKETINPISIPEFKELILFRFDFSEDAEYPLTLSKEEEIY